MPVTGHRRLFDDMRTQATFDETSLPPKRTCGPGNELKGKSHYCVSLSDTNMDLAPLWKHLKCGRFFANRKAAIAALPLCGSSG